MLDSWISSYVSRITRRRRMWRERNERDREQTDKLASLIYENCNVAIKVSQIANKLQKTFN